MNCLTTSVHLGLMMLCVASATPWGVYDGNGGMIDGHYCAQNTAMTNFSWTRGYWLGFTWAATNPEYGVFDFSELDQTLRTADKNDQYVEVNALVGQCSPPWLYEHGVTPLLVNWKPSPTCVPPICVPAGTWNCSNSGGEGCGCDGVPCNQTFPDYFSPIYRSRMKEWINASHQHIVALPPNLRKRILSVQANAGSTGDLSGWHGRLYPDQREAGFDRIENATLWAQYYEDVMKDWIDIYNVPEGSSNPPVALLFGNNEDPVVDTYVQRSSLAHTGYMRKMGQTSHNYAISGEMQLFNETRALLETKLPGSKNLFVRTRGESTLSVSRSWLAAPSWTAWALAAWNAAFGMDTWQNNSLIEEQPHMRPALSFFTTYAGAREGRSNAGAWAVLRDGLDIADIHRWPEVQFGKVNKGHNMDRCLAIINHTANTQTAHPPKLDVAPAGAVGCDAGRTGLVALQDAGYQVYPGNYAQFLEQLEPEATSLGAWRIGPKDEIFGRYGRSALAKGSDDGTAASLLFRVTEGVFSDHEGPLYARVVFFDAGDAGRQSWMLRFSSSHGCSDTQKIEGKGSGHWVEARFELQGASFSGILSNSKCPKGSDVTITDLSPAMSSAVVFNLIELSKVPFEFELTPFRA